MEKIGVISDSALTGWTSKLKRPMLRAPTTLLQSPAVLALRKVLEAWSKESDTRKQDVHKVWCMLQTSHPSEIGEFRLIAISSKFNCHARRLRYTKALSPMSQAPASPSWVPLLLITEKHRDHSLQRLSCLFGALFQAPCI